MKYNENVHVKNICIMKHYFSIYLKFLIITQQQINEIQLNPKERYFTSIFNMLLRYVMRLSLCCYVKTEQVMPDIKQPRVCVQRVV